MTGDRGWLTPFRLVSRCQLCGRWPAAPVCEPCVLRFTDAPARCPGCALRLPPGADPTQPCGQCLRAPLALDACICVVDYAYPWQQLVARLKFQQEPAWATTLARLARRWPAVTDRLSAADVVIPVPLSVQRLAQRGYNQSWELARSLCRPKCLADGLLKLGDTPDQIGQTRAQRLRSVQGSFMANPERLPQLVQRHVLLVDDVMTTGATLNAAADALLRVGVASVSGLCFARTPLGD